MNKAYRLIWSKAKDAWVIVAEIVKGNGPAAANHSSRRHGRRNSGTVYGKL